MPVAFAPPRRRTPSRFRAPVAGYWAAVAAGLIAWQEALRLLAGYPLPVHAALVAMAAVGALWGHSVLFPKRREDATQAPEEVRLKPASVVIPPSPMRAEALFALPRQVQPAAPPVAAAVRRPARPQADPDRMAAAIRAGTGQPVVARLYAEPSGATVALLPEPPPEARLPLPLVQRFCNLVAAESRPETRASLAAVLRAGTGPTLREVMEAYVADNGDGREPAAEPAAPEPAEPPRFSLLEQALPGAARRMA